MKFLGTIFIALLMSGAAAHSALVVVDSRLGPATVIRDTDLQLEWLKPSVTANMSINQVFAAMAQGGRLEGFRYATYDELTCGLLGQHTGLGCRFNWISSDITTVKAFFDLLGGMPPGRSFHTVDPPGKDPLSRKAFGAAFYFYADSPPKYQFDTQQIPLNEERLNQPATHWLVRQAPAAP